MAKDKSKDEVKADIAKNETKDRTVSEAKEAEIAEAVIPVAEDPKTTKTPKSAKKRVTKTETSEKLAQSQTEAQSGKQAVKKEVKHGTTKESAVASHEADEEGQEVETPAEEVKLAKAGRRSAKALKEAEEKQAKEERKAAKAEVTEQEKPKTQQKPARSKLERRSKNFRKTAEQIEKGRRYSLAEALDLAVKTNPVKFDATVELHVRLGVDPKQADQNLRDTVVLPAGTGKTLRVAVFTDDDGVAAAKKAGADIAASDAFLQQLDKGELNFDVLISTPSMMPRLGKHARVLGPKGLMPNPKSGTVTNDVIKAVTEAKAGRVEYRVDSTGIVHAAIGKVSFGKDKLGENARAITGSIKSNKPASIKGTYVKSAYVTTSMGPSIPVDVSEIN